MCQGPTRGGGDNGEKLSLRSQSNIFWANTSFTPLRAHHSAPRLWECSSEPRLRNRQRRISRQPVAPVNPLPHATSAHESQHIVTGRGLKKRTSRAYTRPGRKERRWPWEALCASIVGDDSHVRTLADMHEIQGHGHPGPAAVWCHTLEFLKLSHAHFYFYEMEPLAAYEDWRSFNMKVPPQKINTCIVSFGQKVPPKLVA